MIHLPPLPGHAESPGLGAAIEHALADCHALEAAGFDGVLVENEHDRPHRVAAAEETIAAMTRVTAEVSASAHHVVVGCEILLHDPPASLAVAMAAGARFIRCDYFVDRMTRPEYGEFPIDPQGVLDYRAVIGADEVLILADIQVKYAKMIEPRPLAESAQLAAVNGADAIIVTGDATGDAPSVEHLREAVEGVRGFDVPVLIGSGLRPGNADRLLGECDGAIVGSSLMRNGRVDPAAAAALVAAAGR